MANNTQYIVVAGKLEPDGSENIKYSSVKFTDYDAALRDYRRVWDYPFQRIEVYLPGHSNVFYITP